MELLMFQLIGHTTQILTLDYATREKLLDALTDIVSVDIYEEDIEEIEKRLEGKISELKEFDETFKKLKMFATRLDSHQRLLEKGGAAVGRGGEGDAEDFYKCHH